MKRLNISIMGDSISTYTGHNPKGYEVYYNMPVRLANGIRSVRDTWWSIVIKALHAGLCVNGSYSGSRVSGGAFPAAESTERIEALHKKNSTPDMIMVYIGFNDFGYAVPLQEFSDAYTHMLDQLKQTYPQAVIVAGTLLKTRVRDRDDWIFPKVYNGGRIDDHNAAIRDCCDRAEISLADLAQTEIRYETLDGTHPTAKGHSLIADAWIRCLEDIGII